MITMSKHQESQKTHVRNKITTDIITENIQENSAEITELINSSDFIEFVQSISETIDDKTTFDELLSSRVILQKALAVLRDLQKNSR